MGITRCADVTRLDADFDVFTCCAIRPKARWLQNSNGKGLTLAAAKASALMESIELYHAEFPDHLEYLRASRNELVIAGRNHLDAPQFEGFYGGYYSHNLKIQWTVAIDLLSDKEYWIPASVMGHCDDPMVTAPTSNGLASGNHLVEASLHAIYELIERDAMAGIVDRGRLMIKERCRVIDTESIDNEALAETIRKIDLANSRLILMYLPSAIAVHSFWAVLLNEAPHSPLTALNVGMGTHLDIEVAAARAITESIQSRLTAVQGAREDIIEKPARDHPNVLSSPAYTYFQKLEASTSWHEIMQLADDPPLDLGDAFDFVLAELNNAGHRPILRCDLTNPRFNIPVVRVVVPTLRFNRKLT